MKILDFWERINSDEQLELLGIKDGEDFDEDTFIIKHLGPKETKWAVAVSAVRENDFEQIRAVLVGKRPARVMTHITRIVGYYSQVHNWNKSKIAELNDRHKGNYGVPDAE